MDRREIRDDRIETLARRAGESPEIRDAKVVNPNNRKYLNPAREEEPQPNRVKKHKSELILLKPFGRRPQVNLEDTYLGLPIFLIFSGPSLVDIPSNKKKLLEISQLNAFTFCVNNSWAVHRPTFWTCADGPKKFLSSGWLDPRITKFVPKGQETSKLRKKVKDKFIKTGIQVRDCPNVFLYSRNTKFDHDFYLDEPTVNWGQTSKSKCSIGYGGSRSVMLAAIRLSFYLGFRSIYLLGCDFKMEEGTQNYAFKQERTKSSVDGNNRTYDILNKRFDALLPLFRKKGLSVYNCNPKSGLKVFPFADVDQGIRDFKKFIPTKEDTYGWYD
jgi:hypothetical protein